MHKIPHTTPETNSSLRRSAHLEEKLRTEYTVENKKSCMLCKLYLPGALLADHPTALSRGIRASRILYLHHGFVACEKDPYILNRLFHSVKKFMVVRC